MKAAAQDSEEVKFMERFASFMEERGFLTKVEARSGDLVLPKNGKDKAVVPVVSKSAKCRLDMDDKDVRGEKSNVNKQNSDVCSEITIYRPAVSMSIEELDNVGPPNNRQSLPPVNSSDEFCNTSDESLNADMMVNQVDMINISDKVHSVVNRVEHLRPMEPVAHASNQPEPPQEPILTPKERADEQIKQAEMAKERLLQIPGMDIVNNDLNLDGKVTGVHNGNLLHSVLVDEEYIAIASHIDEDIRRKIIKEEYIDFVRLIPHDRVNLEEDQRMELVNRGGFSYWVPLSERHSNSISNIAKWEEAFWIFSRIYTEGHPNRVVELIQYSHIIHEAALEYPWENVYSYDREFRIHMSKYPTRNWGLILQQAWTLKMRQQVGSA